MFAEYCLAIECVQIIKGGWQKIIIESIECLLFGVQAIYEKKINSIESSLFYYIDLDVTCVLSLS